MGSHIAVVKTNTRKAPKKHDGLREIGKSGDDNVLTCALGGGADGVMFNLKEAGRRAGFRRAESRSAALDLWSS